MYYNLLKNKHFIFAGADVIFTPAKALHLLLRFYKNAFL